MTRLVPLALVLALAPLAACDDEPVDPAQTVPVAEADVERFRTEIFQETLGLDAALARLEQEAAASDSVARLAYEPVLTRLRADRQRLQVRLDSLAPAPRARFDSTRAQVRVQTARLERAIRRARYDAAPTYAALQAATARGLAELDGRLAALRPYAEADTAGGLQRGIDSLAADRGRLVERLGAYPDTLASQFPPFRDAFTDRVLVLERRADALAADTAGLGRPAVGGPERVSGAPAAPRAGRR